MLRARALGHATQTWKSLSSFINDFGKRGAPQLKSRYNGLYPTINVPHNTPINQATYTAINGAIGFIRLPVFYLFYSFMLFKGAGDICQELTTLRKWGGIAPAGGVAAGIPGPGIPYMSTNQPLSAQKFPGTTLSTTQPRYVNFDRNGNAPRFLVSGDRPSGTRFILMMHYAVKTLLESIDPVLCLRQNNINTLAFGGYVTHLYKSIFAKVHNPLYFGAPTPATVAAQALSRRPGIAHVNPINQTQVIVNPYGGKKPRKQHNQTLTKRKHKVTKRKHVTKKARKHKKTSRKHKKTSRKHKVTKSKKRN